MILHAVVLAAGSGSRFGGGKLLAEWRGRPLVAWAVEAALAAPVEGVVVVLGWQDELVEAALAPLSGRRLRMVVAPDWVDGLSASLKAGVAALPRDSAGVLLFLGDMPAIPADLPGRVAAALRSGAVAAQPRVGAAPGHPVGLSAALYAEIMQLTGDVGAGPLLKGREGVVRLDVEDAGATLDVDRPEDLTRG